MENTNYGGLAPSAIRRSRRGLTLSLGLAVLISAVGGIIFGYDTGIIGGAVIFIGQQMGLSNLMQGVVASASLLGGMVGALAAGPLADRYGRKLPLCVSGIAFAAGALFSAMTLEVHLLVAARILLGIGVGASSVLIPIYIAELAPPRIRGVLVSSYQLLITVGILMAYGVNSLAEPLAEWRIPLTIAALFGVILSLGVLFVTESPRWLIASKRPLEARQALVKLRGNEAVEEELQETARLDRLERKTVGWCELLSGPVRPMVVIGVLIAFLTNACGINLVIYFAPQILQLSGFDASASWLATMGLGITNVVFTLLGMALVDRLGRRPMMIGGATGLTLSMLVLAVVFSVPAFTHSHWLAFAALLLYIVMYAVSPGILGFLVISEISPLRARAKVTSLSICVIFATNLVIALVSLPMLAEWGAAATFWLFTAICAGFMVFSFFVPETKGKSLEEVELYFRARHGRKG